MSDHEKKAQDLMLQAEKKLNSSGGFFGLFGNSSKYDDAAELFDRAANAFKMAKNWTGAGNAFCRSAQLHLKQNSKHEAASHYVESGNAFKKADVNEAISCLSKAIEIYTDMGRFVIAAKHHISIAEIYENDLVDIDKTITHYELAADYYKGEDSNSSANKCLLKVAQYAAQLGQYEKAIGIYEQIGESSLSNNLLKYGAKDHFFRAALCRLIQDRGDAEIALDKYQRINPSFADSREYKLLKKLIDAMEEGNVDNFTEAVKEYDSISRLDQWYTAILLKIKKSMEGEVDLR